MSQASKTSTKLMLFVWLMAMIFIGIKALNSTNGESNVSESMIDNAALERIKPITKTPQEIEAETRFKEMVRQDKEQKLRERNSGLAGLMGGVKL